MRSFYLYRCFDRETVLDTVYSAGEARQQAHKWAKQLGTVSVRDALGGLVMVINKGIKEKEE